MINRRGLMLVLSSPSGAGKTTISRMLLAGDDKLHMSVSVTTRLQRAGEINGKDYFFISKDEFDNMAKNDKLIESAIVFNNYYGTPKDIVYEVLSHGDDVLFDVDWQGTQQLAQAASSDLVSVFILPPSTNVLEERLRNRGLDSEEVVNHRMAKASDEISHWAEYDYVVVNHNIDETLHFIRSILTAERLRRKRQTGLVSFVNELII